MPPPFYTAHESTDPLCGGLRLWRWGRYGFVRYGKFYVTAFLPVCGNAYQARYDTMRERI